MIAPRPHGVNAMFVSVSMRPDPGTLGSCPCLGTRDMQRIPLSVTV